MNWLLFYYVPIPKNFFQIFDYSKSKLHCLQFWILHTSEKKITKSSPEIKFSLIIFLRLLLWQAIHFARGFTRYRKVYGFIIKMKLPINVRVHEKRRHLKLVIRVHSAILTRLAPFFQFATIKIDFSTPWNNQFQNFRILFS